MRPMICVNVFALNDSTHVFVSFAMILIFAVNFFDFMITGAKYNIVHFFLSAS